MVDHAIFFYMHVGWTFSGLRWTIGSSNYGLFLLISLEQIAPTLVFYVFSRFHFFFLRRRSIAVILATFIDAAFVTECMGVLFPSFIDSPNGELSQLVAIRP